MTSRSDRARRRQVRESVDPVAGHDLAAGRLELRDERRRRRPAHRRGPSASRPRGRRVPRTSPNAALSGRSSGEHRVRRDPGEQRSRRVAVEPVAGQAARRAQRRQPEPQPAPADVGARGRPAGGARRRASRHRARAARTAAATPGRPRRPERRPWPPPTARARPRGPPSSGWATGASGWTSSTPRAARSIVGKNGEASVSGRIVEQTSWRNPGSVSSVGPRPAAGLVGAPRRRGPSARHGPG